MFIGGRGDWTAVRLAALLRAARLSAHRGEEAHQQLQQGARTRLLGLKVRPVPPCSFLYSLQRRNSSKTKAFSTMGLHPEFFSPKSYIRFAIHRDWSNLLDF
jgi:hypothetical protein